MNMKQMRDLGLMKRVLPIRETIRDWYYHAGSQFLLSRELNQKEEEFLEEVTEFFLKNLDNIEDIEKRIRKKELGKTYESSK